MTKRLLQRDLNESPELSERLLGPDEIFDGADEELLKKLSESRHIERKPAAFSGDKIGDYLCMWANTSPAGGILVCGMNDDGTFGGCLKLTTQQVNDREKAGHVYCPDAKFETKQVRVKNAQGDDDFALIFRVQYNQNAVVQTVAGNVFVRRGDSKCQLKGDEIRELKADKGEVSFEQQRCGLKFPADFNETAIDQFVSRVKKARKLDERLSVVEVLIQRRLGQIHQGEFAPNIACMLLFATDPIVKVPGCKIRFQRFDGELERTGAKYNAVKDEILEGCVAELIAQIETVLESQLRIFSPLDARGKFFPVPEYPKMAWYETVVNACVHRSYGNGMKNMPIFVKMFDEIACRGEPRAVPALRDARKYLRHASTAQPSPDGCAVLSRLGQMCPRRDATDTRFDGGNEAAHAGIQAIGSRTLDRSGHSPEQHQTTSSLDRQGCQFARQRGHFRRPKRR